VAVNDPQNRFVLEFLVNGARWDTSTGDGISWPGFHLFILPYLFFTVFLRIGELQIF